MWCLIVNGIATLCNDYRKFDEAFRRDRCRSKYSSRSAVSVQCLTVPGRVQTSFKIERFRTNDQKLLDLARFKIADFGGVCLTPLIICSLTFDASRRLPPGTTVTTGAKDQTPQPCSASANGLIPRRIEARRRSNLTYHEVVRTYVLSHNVGFTYGMCASTTTSRYAACSGCCFKIGCLS